jgi:hypothetical protein
MIVLLGWILVTIVLPIVLAPHSAYFMKIALAIDILGSAWLNGLPGETLSGRAGSAFAQGKLRGKIFAPFINALFRDPNHCKEAIAGDLKRASAVLADYNRS